MFVPVRARMYVCGCGKRFHFHLMLLSFYERFDFLPVLSPSLTESGNRDGETLQNVQPKIEQSWWY